MLDVKNVSVKINEKTIVDDVSFVLENNEILITGLDIFFILHIGLHLIFLTHKRNEFKDWISWTIIISAGFFGLLDLL